MGPARAGRLGGAGQVASAVVALGLVALFSYGVFWVLWRRELTVDLARRQWVFRTGLGPRLTTIEGSLDAPLAIEMFRKQMTTRHGFAGEGGAEIAGPEVVTWELRLALPGTSEPLFLGEWTDRGEALREAETWRQAFPNLRIEPT